MPGVQDESDDGVGGLHLDIPPSKRVVAKPWQWLPGHPVLRKCHRRWDGFRWCQSLLSAEYFPASFLKRF
jgi:hypothetical protein